ncbi:MAG TPA: [FeFe] hydrogenase H-cluster maturation GTPase HydF [Halanaerobiales bacterium]|nr:[FeFe] hydrogenase H-cluster maturation GTPase HydF [Halanaerobiales bacterium]
MSLNKTPQSERTNIAIYGKRNAGKSSLLNAITAQETSIVSTVKGTTADPVKKAMELIPVGPVLFIDTAGLDDKGELGAKRAKRSKKMMERTDFALYVMAADDFDLNALKDAKRDFKRFNISYLVVVNKIDEISDKKLQNLKDEFPDFVFVSAVENENILGLKDKLKKRIEDKAKETPILGDLVPYNGKVIMVVPIDSEAPKGRLILPQVQSIRDCLDHGLKSLVVRDTELESAIKDFEPDLVVTDSQAFKRVGEMVPAEITLTSFSLLFARYKGDLEEFIKGIEVLKNLTPDHKILISETCTHDVSCEDIGRVKIPGLIENDLGQRPEIEVVGGMDFPENLKEYDLVIHCGACMLNQKAMQTRINFCKEQGVPITNYGMTIAYYHGILERAMEIFKFSSFMV